MRRASDVALDWARHVFRRADPGRSAADASDAGAKPEHNPIRQLLDAAGVPWLSPRAALAKRYGISRHPAYGWEVIAIATPRPIVGGLLWPLSVQVSPNFSPAMPATDFSGVVSTGDDARENLRFSLEQLQPRLGEPRVADNANTIGRRWAFGASALSLTVWPAEMQRRPAPNPAQDRESRLKSACHVSIRSGFRQPATAEELSWLASFVPIAPIEFGPRIGPNSACETPASEYEAEFVRRPIAGLDRIFGQVGRSADRAVLIFCHAQLYLVPMAEIVGFVVERTLPGKGSGGSRLYVECRARYRAPAAKRLLISASAGADAANDLAAALAGATGKPFKLGDYAYDD